MINHMNSESPQAAIAVLSSGGLDSAILLGECLRGPAAVYPLYVRCGLAWEEVEFQHLQRFVAALDDRALQPIAVLALPVSDLYPTHWSVTGTGVPDAASPDEAVFLPGRNVLLLAKAMIWCQLRGVPAVALATLDSNPFPDATAAFFARYEASVNMALRGCVSVFRPYAALSKRDVMRRGRALPLELTFSCIQPLAGHHCGRCNKCAERRRAFADAGLTDATVYGD
jgi:7-cyano-7-deazaguanine synthase